MSGHNIDAKTPEAYIIATLFLEMFNIDVLSIFIPKTGTTPSIDVTKGNLILIRLDLPTK